jgi:hypothetical protein
MVSNAFENFKRTAIEVPNASALSCISFIIFTWAVACGTSLSQNGTKDYSTQNTQQADYKESSESLWKEQVKYLSIEN